MNAYKKYLAEFIGTFVLVFVACGVAVAIGCDVTGGYLATALAFGLVIVAMAYSIGNISGCHINPAVSLAMLLLKKLSPKDFVGYVIAQCLGAIAGAALLGAIFGWDCGFGANAMQAGFEGKYLIGFVVEVVLTCIFVYTIIGVTSKQEYSRPAGLVIAGALTLVHLIGIAVTGTSVNPARSLGPALFAGGEALSSIWIFLLAPLVGGALAAGLHKLLSNKEPAPAAKKPNKKKK